MNSITKRRGRFTISRNMFYDEPEAVVKLLSGMLVFRAELMMASDCVEYMAFSEHFEEVEDGVASKLYEAVVSPHAVTWRLVP